MQVLLICSNFIIEKTPQNFKEGQTPPTDIHLSPLFILAAVTSGQNVIVLMLVIASLSSVS